MENIHIDSLSPVQAVSQEHILKVSQSIITDADQILSKEVLFDYDLWEIEPTDEEGEP
jgi:hypothetical protein